MRNQLFKVPPARCFWSAFADQAVQAESKLMPDVAVGTLTNLARKFLPMFKKFFLLQQEVELQLERSRFLCITFFNGYMGVNPKIRGKTPQIIHLYIGFGSFPLFSPSILGGKTPPICGNGPGGIFDVSQRQS